jgi:DNA-binding transcriptional regulator YhcF (GntR family)
MKKLITIQEILDKDTKIETIRDKETLKNVLRKIIDTTSCLKIRKDDIVTVAKEIYREFDIEL